MSTDLVIEDIFFINVFNKDVLKRVTKIYCVRNCKEMKSFSCIPKPLTETNLTVIIDVSHHDLDS